MATLDEIIHHGDDHVLMLDLGLADHVVRQVISLGKAFQPVAHEPIIV
jgi:CRISPR-associated protein Cas2